MSVLLGLAAMLALGYEIWGAASERPGPRASAAKTGATALLGLAGLANGAPALVVLGLFCGALGDFFLTRRGDRAFLAGMAAFAAGHLLYTMWMFTPANAAHALWAAPLLALALSTERWLLPRTGDLTGAVRAYIWIIAAMGAAAMTLSPVHIPALTGAVLFVMSDLLLALRLFVASAVRAQRMLSLALWPLYWLGQALILIGASG
ncbi:lysoplasmalogenase [Paracoccus aurantiacus]|uniref:Lysoplasmalogenase n=1 Tax=Paracoccus aurantiacus TaxID=2599412 RepID=A0A5C6S9U7_9RHOB|nr:lysoplasmalogenase family protein [Paracoccus aurantiacus]TXB70513.1 lysoplasmalogenase [Paracoccus aurantiacus]